MQGMMLGICQVSLLVKVSVGSGLVYVDSAKLRHLNASDSILRTVLNTSEYLEVSGKVKLPFWIARVLSPNGRLKKHSL